ncbi:WhiB family transcriptional regulator [Streptomyces sp. NBC_01320]|uniref:WhiB family transcriptional regulator n=1 Tax=Streptomyces sp. NBC_01320 TaxID=2903824 RepID=UPI002E0DB000|nr:WhiB family transcriptional regulator [Streptomyces sp. NBC_01320]
MKSFPNSDVRGLASTVAVPAEPAEPLCAGSDPSMFFPDGIGPAVDSQVMETKQVCFACPVRLNCLTDAIRFDAEEGIWAGFTPRERRRLSSRAIALQKFDRQLIERVAAGYIVEVDVPERSTVVMGLYRRGWDELRIADAMKLAPFAVRMDLQAQVELEFFIHAHERAKQMRAEYAI